MNGFCFALAVGMIAAPDSNTPPGAEQAAFQPYVARVTGTNVYVRSGPSTVYYSVTKLKQGEQVTVVGEKYDFAQIVPPTGTYSLVAKDQVEDVHDGVGRIANVDEEVWALAYGGDDTAAHYAKHAPLAPNSQVEIVEELDKHYKIVTPPHAVLWISKDFIERRGGATPSVPAAPPRPRAGQAATRKAPTKQAARKDAASRKTSQPQAQAQPAHEDSRVRVASGSPIEPAAAEAPPRPEKVTEVEAIKSLEARLKTELDKEPPERNLTVLVTEFDELAASHDDPRVQKYARYRADQIRKVLGRADALRRLREIDTRVQNDRRDFQERRRDIRPTPPPVTREFAVIGKMLKSFAYTSPVGPRRYRIVELNDTSQRTLAYVEIPPDSEIDAQRYLGRHVAVRARSKRLLEGAVDPIVVYEAAEIVIVEDRPVVEPPAEP